MEQAAENLGCPPWKRFWRITLPLAMPGVFAGASIVFIWAFTELGVPLRSRMIAIAWAAAAPKRKQYCITSIAFLFLKSCKPYNEILISLYKCINKPNYEIWHNRIPRFQL